MVLRSKFRFLSVVVFWLTASYSRAEQNPSDLELLLHEFEEIIKSPEYGSQELLKVSLQTLEDDPGMHQSVILQQELNTFSGVMSHVTEMSYRELNRESRMSLLKTLFPRSGPEPYFCRAFVYEDLTKVETSGPEEDHEKKLAKARISRCKRLVGKILSGVFYTNPSVYILKLKYTTDKVSQVITFYLRSFLNPKSYIRYQFHLS